MEIMLFTLLKAILLIKLAQIILIRKNNVSMLSSQSMNHKNMCVSIIMPTYNRGDQIEFSIKSIISQKYSNWELLVIDDGSTDNTKSIVSKYSNADGKIKYHFKENSGPALSRNLGIKISTGNFITFLDSDDEYKEDHLEKRIDYMANNPTIDFIHGGVKVIGNEFVRDKNDLGKLINIKDCIVCGTFFGKRNVFIESGGFNDIKYSAESEFFSRIKNCYNVGKVSWETYLYNRIGDDSITKNISK